MSSFQLQLVPSHNKNAGRTFPLAVGRCSTAKWWWKSCPCARHLAITRELCDCCRILTKSTKQLSKKILYIAKDGSLRVVTRKMNHLLWYNGEPMVKSSDTTAILLQLGDHISIGPCPKKPLMDFYVQRIALAVTPEEEDTKKTNIFQPRPTPKSKRRLYYDDSSDSFVSRMQLSFDDDSPRDVVFSTQHVHDDDDKKALPETLSNAARGKTRKRRKVTMNPRRLLDSERKRPPVQEATTNSNDNKKKRARHLPDTESYSSTESKDSRQTRKPSIVATSPRKSLENEVPVVVGTAKRARVASSQRSAESSVLSMPQCPSTEEEEEEDYKRRPLHSQRLYNNKSTVSRAFPQDSLKDRSDDEEDSPAIQFASALSLSDWKNMQQHGQGRVQKAIAGLVVAQRARDSTWFPALLEGAVVNEKTESTMGD